MTTWSPASATRSALPPASSRERAAARLRRLGHAADAAAVCEPCRRRRWQALAAKRGCRYTCQSSQPPGCQWLAFERGLLYSSLDLHCAVAHCKWPHCNLPNKLQQLFTLRSEGEAVRGRCVAPSSITLRSWPSAPPSTSRRCAPIIIATGGCKRSS